MRLDVWPRPGADVTAPAAGFTSDDDGARAREAVRERFARGEEAQVGRGFVVGLEKVPNAVADLIGKERAKRSRFRLTPPPSVPLTLLLDTEAGEIVWQLDVRLVPPREPGRWSLAGYIDDVWCEIEFCPTGPHQLDLALSLAPRPGSSATAGLATARRWRLALQAPRLRVSSPVIPSDQAIPINLTPPPEEDVRWADESVELHEALVAVERRTGIEFTLPAVLPEADVAEILTAGAFLRGEPIGWHGDIEGTYPPDFDVEILRNAGAEVSVPVLFTILGHEIDLGPGLAQTAALLVETSPRIPDEPPRGRRVRLATPPEGGRLHLPPDGHPLVSGAAEDASEPGAGRAAPS